LRLYLRRRQPGVYPSAEEMLVAAPALAEDKGKPTFERTWAHIVAA
jgi:hypothetical protein